MTAKIIDGKQVAADMRGGVKAERAKDKKINGILVQLPLPKHINESKVLLAIDPDKDVDGFHPMNVGKMVVGEKAFLPCTPHGVIQLLIRSGVTIEGAEE